MQNKSYTKKLLISHKAPFLTTAFIPLYPMLYLYNQAENSQYLSLLQVLVVSLVFMLASSVLFIVINSIIKSPHETLCICIPIWIAFFSYGGLFEMSGIRHRYLLPIVTCVLAGFILGVLFFSKKFSLNTLSFFVSILLCILLIVNGGLSVYRVLSLGSYGRNPEYKTSFIIDDALLQPNVYWFHCDGMLGFEAMEKYFGDPQNEFASALASRGFAINREAQFEAGHSTQRAIPTLMCPYFYDTQLNAENPQSDFTKLLIARQKNELIHAFKAKSYNTAIIGSAGIYVFPNTDVFYEYGQAEPTKLEVLPGNENFIISVDRAAGLWELLRSVTPICAFDKNLDGMHRFIYSFLNTSDTIFSTPFVSDTDVHSILESDTSKPVYENLAHSLANVLDTTEPRFVFVFYGMAHNPFTYDESGNLYDNDIGDIHSYPPHHRYARKVLLNLVDMVLEKDPDAIIILQADHGLHGQSAAQIMDGLSASEDAVKGIWNGVMSAVRIPAQYGTPEEPLHPLNITRYLVNHYVGENYQYLVSGKYPGPYQ